MQYITLNTGAEMPILGFGVYQIPNDQTQPAVEAALEVGYRSIDTAAVYRNEVGVGRAIASSGISRDELFITTKLWRQARGEDNTLRACEASLDRLGLEYVDLYLIHQPFGDVYAQWRAMERLYREGRVRAIGVSNFHSDRLVDLILNNEVVPAVNQIELNPFHQQVAASDLMRSEGVQVESWGPFAEGRNDLFNNPLLAAIGRTHGKSIAQVVLRWLIQRDVVAIPKSVTPARIAENFEVFDFELSPEELAQISSLDQGVTQFFDHRDPKVVRRISAIRSE